MLPNFLKPFGNIYFVLIFLLLMTLGGYLWWAFTDIRVMFGNYGSIHTSTDIILSLIMIIGFPLFIIGILYKGFRFGIKESLHRNTGIGAFGGVVGTIISGSSCCGLTLAAYFGLIPLMSLLPYDGIEIKILGTLGLLWALQDTYKNLEVCRVGKRQG